MAVGRSPTVKTAVLLCAVTWFAQLAYAVPTSVLADSKQAATAVAQDTTKDIVKRSSSPVADEPVDPVEERTVQLASVWNRNADDGSVQVRPAPQKRGGGGGATQRNQGSSNTPANTMRGRQYESMNYDEQPSGPDLTTAEDYYLNRYPEGVWADGPIDVSSANAYNLYQMLRSNSNNKNDLDDEDRTGSWNTDADTARAQRKLQQQLEQQQQQQRAYDNLQSMLNANMYDEPISGPYASNNPVYFNPRFAGPSSDRKKRAATAGGKSVNKRLRSKRESYLTPVQILTLLGAPSHQISPRVQHSLNNNNNNNNFDSREDLMLFEPRAANPISANNAIDDLNDEEQWLRTPVYESELLPAAVYRQPSSAYSALAQRQSNKRYDGPQLYRQPRGGFDTRLMDQADAFENGSRKFHSMKFV